MGKLSTRMDDILRRTGQSRSRFADLTGAPFTAMAFPPLRYEEPDGARRTYNDQRSERHKLQADCAD